MTRILWVLRIAVAMEFFGHGWLALGVKPAWIPFITLWGFSEEFAPMLMRVVGAVDIVLACTVLVRPMVPLLIWMTFWGFFTALLRPLAGGTVLDFVERGPNWGAPLALLLLLSWTRTSDESAP